MTAAAILRDGGLVAMPTETVYGLAADALNGAAVRRIFAAKGRPMDNPLIVHVAAFDDIERLHLVAEIPGDAYRLAEAFWPGPLTIIMSKGKSIPDEVSAGLDTVAIRIPSHPDAHRLLSVSGLALAAPSANTSGKPSPTTARHVSSDMDGRIEAILDGGACSVGVESTVITLATDTPRILRPGIITREDIEAVIGPVEVDKAVLNQLEKSEKASSPGMKYKHYAPRAKVVLVRGDDTQFIRFVNRAYARSNGVAAICYDEDIGAVNAPAVTLGAKDDLHRQARGLFDALRAVDEINGVTTVYAHCPSAAGVGMALYNRLIRAAAFEVIDLPTAYIIGLTGLTGAGKSTVAEMLRQMGAHIVSADAAARAAVCDSEVRAALCSAFGDVLRPDGGLDRGLVAARAFATPEGRDMLNAITHPRIISLMLDETRSTGGDVVVWDASQLFEAGADVYCDVIVSVFAGRERRVSRLMQRDGLSQEEIELRMSAQLSEDFFRRYSDVAIENNGDTQSLLDEVRRVYERVVRRE